MFYKRKITALSLCFVLIFSFGLFACKKNESYKSGFAVCFIDVGEGDAIFIHLDSGENILIDTAEKSDSNYLKIDNVLKSFRVKKIDYLVLTQVDSDHVGNAKELIENYSVNKAYIPLVYEFEKYVYYNLAVNLMQEKNIDTEISLIYETIPFNNCNLVFLSPLPINNSESAYAKFNGALEPDEKQKNNLSPIIYLEYKGVRFLFTGDAEKEQETLVVNNYKLGYYNDYNVNLDKVDILKVGHHGGGDCSCERFLQTLKPKNAIISVGGNNFYGHPDSDVLLRLENANPEYTLYRTDRDGTIIVSVDKDGNIKITTERDN